MIENPRNRPAAAAFLTSIMGVTVTAGSLEQGASKGTGPAYSMVLGKAVYAEPDLREWAAAQISAPTKRSNRRKRLTGNLPAGNGPASMAAKSSTDGS